MQDKRSIFQSTNPSATEKTNAVRGNLIIIMTQNRIRDFDHRPK